MRIAGQQGHADFARRYGGDIKLTSIAPVDFHVRRPGLDRVMPAEAETGLVAAELVEARPASDAGGAAIRADDPSRADSARADSARADSPRSDLNAVAVESGDGAAPQQLYAVLRGLIREQRMQRGAADGETGAFGKIRLHGMMRPDETDASKGEAGALREVDPQAVRNG